MLCRTAFRPQFVAKASPAGYKNLALDSYEKHIKGHEKEFFQKLDSEKHGHAYSILLELSGINAKSNSEIGKLADKVLIAIEQEKKVNQDIRMLK